jgi:ABC-2 type transport system ATP-binding protein
MIAVPVPHDFPATPPAPAIRVEGLERRFGERQALAGVSLDIAAGERLALLGPNGSGKSTLLRILGTLLRPSGGRAEIAGLDVERDAAAVRHHLGTVFQSPSLDGKLSVRENLDIQGHLYGLKGRPLRERIAEVLERFGLAERAADRVETLSGGMKRRVELGKILLHRPGILLLDEPSTGLDPAARLDFWTTLLALQQERGLTIVVATHLMDEADRCQRAALLDQGRLIALGAPEELKASIGGPVLDVETSDPDRLAPRIQALGLRTRRIGGVLRIEGAAGIETAQRLQHAFPREILALRLGQPTLEDVFVALTGKTLSPKEPA